MGTDISPEQARKGAQEAAERGNRISALRRSFPEMITAREERRPLVQRNKKKRMADHYDVEFFKDEFRAHTTISAQRLKLLRESTNPELKKMFEIDPKNFMIHDGVMIHGKNHKEKQALFEHYISEAKKYDMDIVEIKIGDRDPIEIAQELAIKFPAAKAKFKAEQKHTMFIMKDADKILNIADNTIHNGPCRATINVNTNNCGFDGITWLSTVDDITKLDDSCFRGGRVTDLIDIDQALALSKKGFKE